MNISYTISTNDTTSATVTVSSPIQTSAGITYAVSYNEQVNNSIKWTI